MLSDEGRLLRFQNSPGSWFFAVNNLANEYELALFIPAGI